MVFCMMSPAIPGDVDFYMVSSINQTSHRANAPKTGKGSPEKTNIPPKEVRQRVGYRIEGCSGYNYATLAGWCAGGTKPKSTPRDTAKMLESGPDTHTGHSSAAPPLMPSNWA